MADDKPKQKKTLKRQISKLYDISGSSAKLKNKSCPKCGQGVFMANHSNRWFCGRCHYTEFKG